MGISAARSAFVVALGASVWLSLRPDPRLEGWLDLALAPSRVLAEACAPFAWLRLRSVEAAEEALASRQPGELDERTALHLAERRAALPSDPSLRAGRRFVHAEVVGRRARRFDELEVRVDADSCAGLERGMPVTVGDTYVGRLLELDVPVPGRATVELVTARQFAVGAVVPSSDGSPGVRCVVGGIASISSERSGRIFLALSSPSRREIAPRMAQVDESVSALARYAEQASGFALGTVEAFGPHEWALRPLVDFRSGLFQVVIAAPAGIERAAEPPPRDELFDGRWLEVRATSSGEPSVDREGFELGVGSWNGARPGAALVVGARLVGRVEHAGALTSDARALGDAGFSVHVLARVEGRPAPIALGRVVSLGRPAGGRADEIEFAWEAVVGLESSGATGSLRAELFTGSGDALVPRGLVLGETELPAGPGPHRLLLRQGVDTRDLRHVWLRLEGAGEGAP